MDYSALPRHNVLCVDIKSFFASVEAYNLTVDPLTAYIAVIGDKKRSGSIVLAASPMMKKEYRIKTGSRLYEIPTGDPRIHVVEANMGQYLQTSIEITKLMNKFVPMEAIHQYSIDEFWITADGIEGLFGDRWELARQIQQVIYDEFRLPSCIGIGPNRFLSKVILDTEAKKKGIAECQYEDVQQKLWPLPVEEIWGIGRRMKRNLNRQGIVTLGDLARYPLSMLKKRFGIMGEQMWYHAWGVDLSPVLGQPYDNTHSTQKGYGHGITLLRDYTGDEVGAVLLDLAEEVCRRTRTANMCGRTIHFGIGYSNYEGGGGFSRSRSIDVPTNVTLDVYKICMDLFRENYNGGIIRSVHLSLNNLSPDDGTQLNLFENNEKKHRLGYVMDSIRAKYGPTAILWARSYTDAGVALDRSKKIGGHRA
ncbi:UV damage repair protein UvrX [Peribacillus cavernae]|uniref:UV damage repair protein UvrX n=1 Tax=Peribacillus cavernae TaxID=1674310 RepID=A0A433HDZ3_9BACI|nr:UV damage repair protein UvrX [Peribacillus cavernae]